MLQVRLPRVVIGLLVGIGLAVSGVVLQGMTHNDLASPSTLGINGGCGLGIMFLLVMYPTAATTLPSLLPVAAVAGALSITILVFALSYQHGIVLPSRLLLVGIAIGFGAQAAMLMLALRMSYSTYYSVVTWMSGTLANADWKSVWLLLPCCVLLIPAAWSRSRVLDTLSLGDQVATSLGVAVQRQRFVLIGIATVLTGTCVALGGHIVFLGLVAPHLARRLVGVNHFRLIPAAALCGAILLIVADTLGRYLFAPVGMPAGVLVGALGGIYFLYLLATTKG